jgi:hypothetical protein
MGLFIALMNSNPYAATFDRDADKIRVSGTLWAGSHRYADARLGWLTIRNTTQHSRFTTRHVGLYFTNAPTEKITGETQDAKLLGQLSSLTGLPVVV